MVGDPGEDRRVLGQHLAVVEHQRRHLAFRIDVEVAAAALDFFRPEVDLDHVELKPRFEHGDMIGETAKAGCVVEFHRAVSSFEGYDCKLQPVAY